MKKTLLILTFGALPVLALATGSHGADHGMEGRQAMQGHDMAGMHEDKHASLAGQPGDPARVSRTIDITMDDSMRFAPDTIQVKKGETVRFTLQNAGRMTHEMVLGTPDELKEHAAMMRRMPMMQHAEPNMIRLAPGQRGSIVWRFAKPGTVDFACLVPGHMEAGMMGKVVVE